MHMRGRPQNHDDLPRGGFWGAHNPPGYNLGGVRLYTGSPRSVYLPLLHQDTRSLEINMVNEYPDDIARL